MIIGNFKSRVNNQQLLWSFFYINEKLMFLIKLKSNSTLDGGLWSIDLHLCSPWRLVSIYTEPQDYQSPHGVLFLGHEGLYLNCDWVLFALRCFLGLKLPIIINDYIILLTNWRRRHPWAVENSEWTLLPLDFKQTFAMDLLRVQLVLEFGGKGAGCGIYYFSYKKDV